MTRSDNRRRHPAPGGTPARQPGSRSAADTRRTAAVVVYAKAPIEGSVKTRLCPPLTADEAASLHGSLVMDQLERCRSLKGCEVILAGSPSSHHPFFKAMQARFGVSLWDQQGEDLGVRMSRTFKEGLSSGYAALVVVGTDIPGVTAQILTQAITALRQYDVVIGPTQDGGYYLIGLRQYVPELFQHIPWSTDRVCALTCDRVAASGLSLSRLPVLRDVDTIDDLRVFLDDVARSNPSAQISQRTKQVFQELKKRVTARQESSGTT